MPRPASNPSIDTVVRDAAAAAVQRASLAIARTLAQLTAKRIEAEIQGKVIGRRRPRRRRPARGEITRWAADRRARRVPNFVIDLTGLATKKQIVQRYGAGALFERGKAPPRAKG